MGTESTARVVMKFGGTSVGTPEAMARTARLIVREKRSPVVVVSALGGVTNMLLQAAGMAKRGEDYHPLLTSILERHRELDEVLSLGKAELLGELKAKLTRLLSGIEMLSEFSPRTKDALLSLGERMSVRLLAALLCKHGVPARGWDSWELGMVTDGRFTRAALLPEADPEIQRAFRELVKPGEVPVVTGFIGRSIDGEITTLGRGGSDFSAAVFGASIQVEEIQIWTDVPGFLRADPRIVGETEIIPTMRFEEAAELAYFGAKVLHPRTIEPAQRQGIPVRILGTFQVDPDEEPSESLYGHGTLIDVDAPEEPLRAIALREGVHTLYVYSSRMLEAPGFLSRVFEVLSRHQISVDVIATSEVSISMTFDRSEGDEEGFEGAIEEISTFAQVEHWAGRSLLCLVGAGLRRDSSLLARIFQILADHKVPMHVISQGASRINITIVTDPEPARTAMQALHEALFQERLMTWSGEWKTD